MDKKRFFAIPLAAALLTATPSQAAVDAVVLVERLDAIHVNVFRPLAETADRLDLLGRDRVARDEVGDAEVSMFAGKLEVLVDTAEWSSPEEGVCVDIAIGRILDGGCGPLTVETDRRLGEMRVSGIIETTAYELFSDPFELREIGASEIEIDLTVTGTGLIERSPYSNFAVGVCGFPVVQGVFADLRAELQRRATADGTLASAAAGAVDPSTLAPLLVQQWHPLGAVCLADNF